LLLQLFDVQLEIELDTLLEEQGLMEEHEGEIIDELHEWELLEGEEQEKQLDIKLDELKGELKDEHSELMLED
jgi:hypothetical protein